ncbi:hypothetical protein CA54_06190 [Symmachiella macrocystis]|uniref:Methanolan biosynthesis EpsI domain-containing protein n=1 Tax=Symmachiella macrocystis TaxID=2527985 RepID=A0A5C6BIB6_9PLAN|nr:exosortase-associated EpsI family protein [Symmachiella macrocystis]TWU11808.1 hypothetical protein CA54_06190 [Symmachiella macrocystis]
MKTAIALAIASLVTVASAQLQPGRLYQQAPAKILDTESQRLANFPVAFGDWESQAEGDSLPEGVQTELGLENYLSRIYRNRKTNQQVALLIMVGSPGRLVRHPPDICYSNRGSRTLSTDEILIEDADAGHSFRSLAYVGDDSMDQSDEFVVAYGHTADSQWDVPRFPRFTYGSESFLYKMQVLVAGGDNNEERIQTAQMFLTDCVQAFQTLRSAK